MKLYLLILFSIISNISLAQFDFLDYSLISFPEKKYECKILTDINKKGNFEIVKTYHSENRKVSSEFFPLYPSIKSLDKKYDYLSNLNEIKINYNDSNFIFIRYENFYNEVNLLYSTLVFSYKKGNDRNNILSLKDSFNIVYYYKNGNLITKENNCIGLRFNAIFSKTPEPISKLTFCDYIYKYYYTENKLSYIEPDNYEEKTYYFYDKKEFNKLYDVKFMPRGNFILLNKNDKPKLVTINKNRNIIEYSLSYSMNNKIKLIKQYQNEDKNTLKKYKFKWKKLN